MSSDGVVWSGVWSEATPVATNPEGSSLPMYLSLEDALDRILSASAEMVLVGKERRDDYRLFCRRRLEDGQVVEGYRLIKSAPRPRWEETHDHFERLTS